MSEFQGKVAIVTGAGGGLGSDVRGEGRAATADALVAEIRAAGGSAVASRHSVTDPEQARAIVEVALEAFGTLDILINNAGILRNRTFKNTTLADFRRVVEVHLLGSAYVTHAAWPVMYAKNYGRVVFTTSVSGIFGQFGQSAYGSAKMGLVGLMNVLALEGRAHGIAVNCLSPGADTRMTALDAELGIDPDNPRPGAHPRLVTPAALYLVSESAPTGTVLHALSGRYLRSETFANRGVALGARASYEDLLANIDAVMDLDQARPLAEPGDIARLGE